MFRPANLRAAIFAAALLTPCLLPVTARADVTFPVSISGTIYGDDVPPVRISCRGTDGNTMTFKNGDIDTGTLPSITIAPTCGLHSSQGLFTNGEAWNGETIDDEAVQSILTRSIGGPESSQETLTVEKKTTNMQELRMILEYAAKFPIDDSGSLVPPIASAKGKIFMTNDAVDQIFVGTFQTGRPLVP